MQLLGIGLTEQSWSLLIDKLQVQLSISITTSPLLQEQDVCSDKIIATCKRLAKTPLELIFLRPSAFETPDDCYFFVTQFQQKRTPFIRCAFVIEELERELGPVLQNNPEIRLVNRMRFHLSHPSPFVATSTQRFPRLKINHSIKKLRYRASGQTVDTTLEELPADQLIALSQIVSVMTDSGIMTSDQWIDSFLTQQKQTLARQQVKGILKVKQHCYLFPGIALDQVDFMEIQKIQVHYLLDGNFSTDNPAFKRLIKHCKAQQTPPEIGKSDSILHQPVRCLGNVSIINEVVCLLLREAGYQDVKVLSNFPPGSYPLEQSMLWLQLEDFANVSFSGAPFKWYQEIKQLLLPLQFFVEIHELKVPPVIHCPDLSRIELNQQREALLKKEKQLTAEHRLAHNKYLLYSQEEKILDEVVIIAEQLTPCLAKSRAWEEVWENTRELQTTQALLLCEDEELASELSRQLNYIPKTLWMNPLEYQNVDQLLRINVKTFQDYVAHGIIVVTQVSLKHLESLCAEAISRSRNLGGACLVQQQVMSQTQKELYEVLQQKHQLALHWIYSSLKKILTQAQKAWIQHVSK
ncbi:hypothetical protein WDW89_10470 [Deltaproteobacteria bacterium TL4]